MNFGLLQPFWVDDESLDTSTKALAFTLGVEWGMVWQRLKHFEGFSEQVHRQNADRITAMLTAQGRRFTASPGGDFVTFFVDGLN